MAGMTPEIFWHWVGGRRFVLTVGAGIVHTLLLWFDKIDKATFKELSIATVGVYIASNTVQKWKEFTNAKSA